PGCGNGRDAIGWAWGTPRRAHGARGAGPPPRRRRQVEPCDRGRAGDQRAHGRPAPPEHLRQARRPLALGRDRVRVRTRSGLIRARGRASTWSFLTTPTQPPIG